MKKIFVLTHSFPFNPPIEQFFSDEMRFLSKRFDEVNIIPCSHTGNGGRKREIDHDNVKIHVIKRKNKKTEVIKSLFGYCLFNISFYHDVFKMIKKNLFFSRESQKQLLITYINDYIVYKQMKKYIVSVVSKKDDIMLYTYWLRSCSFVMLKKWLNKKGYKKVKCISRAHGSSDLFAPQKTKNFLPRLNLYNKIDRIYTTSNIGLEYLKTVGINSERLKVGYLGIINDFCEQQKACQKSFLIVSCSTVVNIKRIDKIVNALSGITNINIRWVHFGDGPMLNDIVKMSKEKLKDNIDYNFMGNTDNHEILKYYHYNHPCLFINTSSIEGLPISIIEAISFGIPVIATDVGGTREVCVNRDNGILLKKECSDEELSNTIISFLEMGEDEYLRYSSNALELFKKKFDARNNYLNFVDELIEMNEGLC